MKATTTNQTTFPTLTKLFVFVVLISGLAFLSCMVTNAQFSNETTVTAFLDEVENEYAAVIKSNAEIASINMDQVWAARLERALVSVTEENIEVESWMFDADFATEINEETLEVEDWMLDVEFTAEDFEEAIELEPWMLDTDYFIRAEYNEDPIELEDWMLN
jgi:hypothetical protein